MRIKGGQPLFLCTLCSHKCEPIQVAAPKKKGLLGLFDTVKLKFGYHATRQKSQR
jgi:hypothetical protein